MARPLDDVLGGALEKTRSTVSKVLPMWNKIRGSVIRVLSGTAIAAILLGAGCDEAQKKEAAQPTPKKEAVQEAPAAAEQKAPETSRKDDKKPEAPKEKPKPSPNPTSARPASGPEVNTRVFSWWADLTSPDHDIRSFAAVSLLRSGDKAALDKLTKLLGNGPDEIRLTIIKAFEFEKSDAATGQLIALLSDQNASPEIRHAAAAALGASASPDAIKRMAQVLTDATKPPATRAAVAEALGKTGQPQAVDPLITLLSENDVILRRAAAEALVAITYQKDMGDDPQKWREWWEVHRYLDKGKLLELANKLLEKNVEFLAGRVRDLSNAVAEVKIRDLDNRPDKNDPAPLIKELKDINPKVRIYLAQELGKIKRNDAAFNALVSMLSDKEMDVRIAVAGALGDCGDKRAADRLIEGLKSDPEPHVRVACAEAFRKLASPSPRVLRQLMDSLDDQNVDVSVAAANALGELGDASAADKLIAVMSSSARPAFTRQAVAGALGNLHERKAVPPLVGMLRDSDDRLRWLATEALGKLGDPEAVEPLCHVVEFDASPNVRERAAMSLGTLRDKSAIDPLCARVNDSDASVSKAAIEALFTIAGDDCDKLMQVGQVLIAKPDYTAAVRFFEKLVEKYADNRDHIEDVWRAKDALAQCYAKTGDWKKARPLYDDLLKRYPERADIRQGLVRAMVQDKEFKGAAEYYLECLKQGPEPAQAWWPELYNLLNEHLGEMSGGDVVSIIQEAQTVDPKLGGDAWHEKFQRLQKKAEQMAK